MMSTSQSFSERATARENVYGAHMRPHTTRTTCVPEDLQAETVFVVLEAERRALFDARARAVKAAQEWWTAFNAAQETAGRARVPKDVEIALEEGTELPPAPVDGLVSVFDRSRVQWPYAAVLDETYWKWLHRCLDAEERARVVELGSEPIR